MPDYVYALHDFAPEHEDEVDFRAGERIEVVEKDDLYGDGWWQGRNLAGKVGLFPKSYTTPAPPVVEQEHAASSAPNGDAASNSRAALQTLAEESEGESPIQPNIASPVPKPPLITFLNGNDSDHDSTVEGMSASAAAGDGEMMKATLTDVQKAIEQLGRNRVDGDGARSFSFASTQDGGTESETDFDLSDVENIDDVGTQGDWHKGARRKLAEKARKAVEEAQRLEDMMGNGGERRSTAPPIDVELSDDSDEEGDLDNGDFTSSSFQRNHPHIPEEDEDEVVSSPADFENKERFSKHQQERSATTITPQPDPSHATPEAVPPTKEEVDLPTATRPRFPDLPTPYLLPAATIFTPQSTAKSETATVFYPPPEDTPTPIDVKRSSAPTANGRPLSNVPSPTVSSHASGFGLSKPFDANSVSSITQSVSTNLTSAPTQTPLDEKKEKKHPNDWSVDDVIDWLKSRGFDSDVCDKFTEQEITGDVLLELDVNILKTEIGILAFGKRMRIANAIAELRRPPSIASYDPSQDVHTPSSMVHQPPMHFRSQSQAHSHHSFPGTPLYANSLGSPIVQSASSNGPMGTHSEANHVNGNGNVPAAIISSGAAVIGVGLGIGMAEAESNGKATKGRPAQLMISPSEGALKDKIIIDAPTATTPEEDRAHMSDGDIASSKSKRRRLFGRSHDSSVSVVANSSRPSKDGASPAPSSSTKDTLEKEEKKDMYPATTTVGTRPRPKKSTESKGSERLSIFGSTFTGSLSKGRKPPPSEDSVSDSKSMFSRLHGSSIRKTSSNRPITPSGSPKSIPIETKEKTKDKGRVASAAAPVRPSTDEKSLERYSLDRDRTTLRKRTVSAPTAQAADEVVEPTGEIKPGQSILEQVGVPDHTGWMRKKAVRYNTWKLRYFVLKGEHLYILRANSKTETRLKGYINIHGYRVTVDETLDPGRYCFRIDHDNDKTHFFSSEEKPIIREWMKAIMKATIGRDYTKPVVSSCNIPTIPLVVAQAMNPAPRPPSPGARDATQKALRRENPHQLSSRDARVLMGLANGDAPRDERKGVQNFFTDENGINGGGPTPTTPQVAAPPRPSREMRRKESTRSTINSAADESLIDWGNSHLPESLQVTDALGPLFGGLHLLRIAESVKGKPASPPVSDSAFPVDAADDKLDGLFRLFDFLLDNEVKMGSVSINDIRQAKRDKILQLLKALKAWEDKRRALSSSLVMSGSVAAGGFMVPVIQTHY